MGKYSVTFGYQEHEAGVCRDFGAYPTLDLAMSAAWTCAHRFEHLDDLVVSVHFGHDTVWSLDAQGNESQLELFREAA